MPGGVAGAQPCAAPYADQHRRWGLRFRLRLSTKLLTALLCLAVTATAQHLHSATHINNVCVESLKVKNMIRNPKLSRAIADAGWGEFVCQLEYKSEWSGRTVVAIEPFFPSSKRCSDCGYTMPKMALNVVRGYTLNAGLTMIVT